MRFTLHKPWPDFLVFYVTPATGAAWIVPKKYINIENRQPVQLITSLPEMLDAFETIDELPGTERLVVGGPRPRGGYGFKEEKPGVVRIA